MYALLETTDFASMMAAIPESFGVLLAGVGLVVFAVLLRSRSKVEQSR